MKNHVLLSGLLVLMTLPVSSLLADDVKLKNGKVIHDVNLIKKTKRWYRFRKIDGKELRFKLDLVVEVIRKPTLWDEYKGRLKKIGKKDADGLVGLGLWARKVGLKKDWRRPLQLAIKADHNHVGANQALGNVLVEGKWLSGKRARKARERALEEQYRARGWRKLGQRWLSKAAYSREKNGWVQVGGHWVTPKLARKISSKKLTWFEGSWLTSKELAKAQKGYRIFEGRWLPLEDLNDMHNELETPWKLTLGAVEVRSTCSHPKALRAAIQAQEAYAGMVSIFGEEADIYGDEGPLILYVVRDIPQYQATAKTFQQDEFEALHSNSFGAWFGAHAEGGAAFTYYFSDLYLRYWVGYGVAQAFVARMAGSDPLETGLMIALAGYACALHEGKYAPSDEFFNRFLRAKVELEVKVQDMLGSLSVTPDSNAEWRVPIAGFFMHYLQSRNPAGFQKAMTRFVTGQESEDSIIKTILGNDDEDALNKDYQRFASRYSATYQGWKPK